MQQKIGDSMILSHIQVPRYLVTICLVGQNLQELNVASGIDSLYVREVLVEVQKCYTCMVNMVKVLGGIDSVARIASVNDAIIPWVLILPAHG